MAFNREIPRVSYPEKYPDIVGHVAPSPSALSSLLTDTGKDANNEKSYCLRTDNYLILHQKDLENRIGLENVRQWIKALDQSSGRSSAHQQALDKLSDRDLFSLVRSRHIQAPADLSAYVGSIVDDAVDLARRRLDLVRENAEVAATRQAATNPPAPAAGK